MAFNIRTEILDPLEKLMYGYNYQVEFGIDVFDRCYSIADFKRQLKGKYPDAQPEDTSLVMISEQDMWVEINYGLDYRGDGGAGLSLDAVQQVKVDELQKQYRDFIHSFIDAQTILYIYPDMKGIPGYPVWWDYRFVLQANDHTFVFIYGSSSD